MKRVILAVAALTTVISLGAQTRTVTSDRIVKAASEPQNWLTYSGNYNGQLEHAVQHRDVSVRLEDRHLD